MAYIFRELSVLLGTHKPPGQWAAAFFPLGCRVGHEAHHLPLSSAGWSYISAIPICLHLLVPTSSVAIKQCAALNAKHHVKVTTRNRHPCAASIKILDFRAFISGMAWTWIINVTFTHPHGCIWSLKLSIELVQKCDSNLWLLES